MAKADNGLWWALGLGAGAVGLYFWGRPIASAVVDVVSRGTRLSYTTLNSAGITTMDGVTPVSVDDLVEICSLALGQPIDGDTLALARMARSEGIAAGDLRIHVALNDMADLNTRLGYGWSAQDLITYSTDATAKGFFGIQTHRRYASSQDCYAGDISLVVQTVAQHNAGVDPTGGAVKFVDKSSFGIQADTGTYDAIVAEWATEGLQPSNVPGYSDDFVVFRRA